MEKNGFNPTPHETSARLRRSTPPEASPKPPNPRKHPRPTPLFCSGTHPRTLGPTETQIALLLNYYYWGVPDLKLLGESHVGKYLFYNTCTCRYRVVHELTKN